MCVCVCVMCSGVAPRIEKQREEDLYLFLQRIMMLAESDLNQPNTISKYLLEPGLTFRVPLGTVGYHRNLSAVEEWCRWRTACRVLTLPAIAKPGGPW